MANTHPYDALIVGAGAAGLLCAGAAAGRGLSVLLVDKNDRPGRKLRITGKGRCNVTNNCDNDAFLRAVRRNPRFLYSAINGFSTADTMALFEELGVPLKTERGNRVFPVSDRAGDIVDALCRYVKRSGAAFHKKEAEGLLLDEGRVKGVICKDGTPLFARRVVIATGGLSYPGTGSTGDGYRFARELGHTVKECRPSLVPMETGEGWTRELQGLSLRNVSAAIYDGKKKLYEEFGEMLFTHYGVSGPLMLTASSYVGEKLISHPLKLMIDLKPALSQEQLDHRILRDFEENKNRQFKNSLGKLFPAKLIPVMVDLSGINPEKKVHEISREERRAFVELVKALPMTLTGLRGFNEAIITKGGVHTKEIDPGTMESRLVKGLYFAGEVLDLDAVTGGFNLQIAWSTGYAAGNGI